ncbi:diphosphomevalonate decarboxylase [Opisthorchis viverrini]|uniref:Diphosphomevalonate decarboxylase n=1 Tax=Opisthorchis viverrini TaxID=6198 RepID=A0A1S8WRR8_OPIVI|nr:diphosphomevalonate decarboxylase [Opisthorchis viverrini]
MSTSEVRVSAPVNIAITKYWGKLDELNIHPVNSSISMTLNQDQVFPLLSEYIYQLMTTTRLVTGPDLTNSSFSLNGRMYEDVPGRIKDVIIIAQLRARLAGRTNVYPHLCIESINSFPTAAGLASSASGLAALAFGLTKLYRLDEDPPSLARRGSGSACRSLYGGFVHWIRSNDTLCSTGGSQTHCSTVHELYPASYWPELKVLICVASSHKKSTGSTTGMQRTVNTSQLFQRARCESVKQHELLLLSALRDRDFENFARIAMQESNQLHAVCLDTWPPCIFLTDVSLKLMNWVHLLNRFCGKTVVAYTFDAGPNAFLFAEESNVSFLLHLLALCFGTKSCETTLDVPSSDHVYVTDPVDTMAKSLLFRGIKYPVYSRPIDTCFIHFDAIFKEAVRVPQRLRAAALLLAADGIPLCRSISPRNLDFRTDMS